MPWIMANIFKISSSLASSVNKELVIRDELAKMSLTTWKVTSSAIGLERLDRF